MADRVKVVVGVDSFGNVAQLISHSLGVACRTVYDDDHTTIPGHSPSRGWSGCADVSAGAPNPPVQPIMR
jgi:hypothetical protein